MADPLQVIRSLDRLADHYAVFEPDQVLTHGQLNSLSDYLDDQQRLGRVLLDGVGLVGGLHVSLQGDGSVRISAGFGVSTDGDLMRLGADTLYDRFRPYDATAAVYPPLHQGDAMLALQELVPVGESDVLAEPLGNLTGGAAGLSDKAVLMLMETVVNDPDLCSGTGCDNLGRDALHRLRFLLIARADAQALLDARPLLPVSTRAQALPALAMRRPALARDIGSVGVLAARYRDSANLSLRDLLRALALLARQCGEVLSDMFGSDPTGRWQATLEALSGRMANSNASGECQVWYSFIKDLIAQWGELREALLKDDGVLLPDVAAFPKHLLLGALAEPRAQRSALYPSALDASARQSAAHGRFLAWKLDALIRNFALPTDLATTLTPSHGEARTLEERAIPWYFGVNVGAGNDLNRADGDGPPIHLAWNFRLSASRREGQNLGYRSASWASSAQARDPLGFAIGGYDFFRVEGHLGRQIESVGDELRRLIASRNLPVHVQEVLLHNDRKLIKRRPPMRHTPLHSLHYLMRQDVSHRLEESQTFGSRYLGDITSAVGAGEVPAATDTGASVITSAGNALSAISSVQASARPVLGQTSHSGYKAQMAAGGIAWKASYATALESVGNTRANLGHVSRPDFVSPYDSLVQLNTPHWIDWLDDLIQADDDRADDKLLFARFVQDHPGLDHLGGVWRGGTLVLVYDDAGRVVADFTLPYPAAEPEAPEPVQPPLTRPPYRPPVVVTGGLRVLKPLKLEVLAQVNTQFKLANDGLQFQLEKQAASIEGLVKGVFVPNNAVSPKRTVLPGLAGLDGLKGDSYLEFKARDMGNKLTRVQELQDMLTQPTLPDDSRVLFERDLAAAQTDLAAAVATVTERVVTSKIEVASDAGLALSTQLGRSVSLIQDGGAKAALDTRLTGIASGTGVAADQSALIGKLRQIGGIGRG